ncbi:MAG: hypothetical protein FWF90_06535 [Promicromonosporaceae bacterium]|nr:hypothetical protein [Promicromonosporaceae bacterium]
MPLLPGDPAAIDDAVRLLAARATTLEDAAARLSHVRAVLADERTAAAASADDRLAEGSGGALAAARLATGLAGVLTWFGERLRSHQAAARQAAERHADAVARVAHWAAERERAEAQRRLSPDASWQPTVHEAAREEARARDDAQRALADHHRATEEQQADARQAAAQVQALADTRVVRAWASGAPVTVAAFVASRSAGLAASSDLARLVRDGSVGSAPTEQAGRLRRLLEARSGDPVFWAAFWERATPAQLYAAADLMAPGMAIARRTPAAREEWAALLRAIGTGTASTLATLSPAERARFGRRIAEDVPAVSWTAPEVAAALFGALPLWVAPRPDPAGPAAPTPGQRAAADVATGVLTVLDDDPRPGRPPCPDLAAAALATLARDPAAALGYLAPEDPAELRRRATHWLGGPAPWPDHGEGVAAALAAAVLAGATSPSRAEQARAAQLASVATTQLPSGLLRNEPLSSATERDVARAYHPYLAGASQLGRTTDAAGWVDLAAPAAPSASGRPGTRADVPLADGLGAMPQPVQPHLDALLFREVIVGSSTTSAGAAAWLADALDHEEAVLEAIFPADGSDAPAAADIQGDADRQSVVRETLRDAGAVAGALQVASVRTAELADARDQAMIDDVATVASVPIGGVVAGAASRAVAHAATRSLGTVGDESVKLAADRVVTTAADAAKGGFLHATRAARHDVAVQEPVLRREFADPALAAAEAWSQARGSTPEQAARAWHQLRWDEQDTKDAFDRFYENGSSTSTGAGQ